MPAHPDTIPDLAPDTRRELRREYLRIQSAAAAPLDVPSGADNTQPLTWHSADARAEREQAARAARSARVADAIAEYRRVAGLWGVEV